MDWKKRVFTRKNSFVQPGPSGFTMLEMVVTIAIIVILLALMVPGFKAIREHAKSDKCMSNLRQIGIAMQLYTNDNNQNGGGVAGLRVIEGVYPPSILQNSSGNILDDWAGYISSEVDGRAHSIPRNPIFMCPSMAIQNNISPTYAAHAGICPIVDNVGKAAIMTSRIRRPGEVILVADAMQLVIGTKYGGTFDYSVYPALLFDAGPLNPFPAPYTYVVDPNPFIPNPLMTIATSETPIVVYQDKDNLTPAQNPGNVRYRHRGTANVLFCDGRVSSMKKGAIKQKHVVFRQY